jgi:hypothetical protein
MLPTDNLVSEAVKMGQQVAQMTGQLFAKKPVKGMPGKFYVIALNFYGQEDFQVLARPSKNSNSLASMRRTLAQSFKLLSLAYQTMSSYQSAEYTATQ